MPLSNLNKVRLIALYIQYRDGVPDEDRRRLYQHARLNLAEQDVVNALVHFGVRVTKARYYQSVLPFSTDPYFRARMTRTRKRN